MVKKKKTTAKLKSKKLEDRIAPGMVGGGIVDPGMVDGVENLAGDSDGSYENVEQTQTEQIDNSAEPSSQYLDEASSHQPENYSDQGSYSESVDSPQEDYGSDQQYDEFSSEGQVEGEFNEPGQDWQEPDWVSANADGSIEIHPPEGVVIDADAGIANFPLEVANSELPLPEDVQILPSGGLEMPLPEGAEYLQESNQLLIPQDQVSIEDVPENMDAHVTPDGSIMVNLPDDGVNIDPQEGTVQFDNYWANEMTPENIEIQENGSVDVQLPEEGVEYNDDGSIHLNAEASEFMGEPAPEYCNDMDCATYNVDGSITVDTPDGVHIDGGVCEVPYDIANAELPLPEEFELNSDGTSSISLGEGVEYNENVNGLTFPEGEINLNEVPEGVDAHVNPDGTTTVMLQDGMEYDAPSNQVSLDNYWTNEVTPDNCHVSDNGTMSIALPEGTEYYDDASFNIPSEQVNFINEEIPAYVDNCDWTNTTSEGGYSCLPPEGIDLNVSEGELSCPNDMISENIPLDDGIHFNSDGTMNVEMPDGTSYSAEANQLTFPAGEVHMEEIPEQVNPQLNSDGSISVTLQDGMNYDTDVNSIQLDNYWTNELIPEPVEFTPEGELIVDLPSDCQFHEDGSFVIPEGSVDFIENPNPAYCTEGPDWVQANPDGSMTLESNENFTSVPQEGYIEIDNQYINNGFEDYTPEGVEFHQDGTMSAQVPDGTLYDGDSNALTFPIGEMHMDEIPEGVEAQLNPNGSITVSLQDGMDYNAESGSVHFDNHWTNEMTPDCVEFNTDGQCHVNMPHDTHFYDDGSVQIPEASADFVENPYPEYVNEGPEWVNDNPDGSVTVTTPEGISVNAEEGYVTMSAETAMSELGGDLIPEEIQLNGDGTIDMAIPADINFDFDATNNSFTLTETPENFNINEVPDFLNVSVDANGVPTISLPEGVNYDADAGSLNISNSIANEMIPDPIEFTNDGQFQINLPQDTQYFGDAFVISAESADFIDENPHGNDYETEHAAAV